MTTRIYHRIDTTSNWNDAIGSPGAGRLALGELGILTTTTGSSTVALGYLGIQSTETPWNQCPMVFFGSVNSGATEPVFSVPVIYQTPAETPPTGSTLSYDATNDRWVVEPEVLTLDAYPTANGSVAWDHLQGKFVVGAAVNAAGIDGGTYS